MLVTRHIRCPRCHISYEVQREDESEDTKYRCEYCGAPAQAEKPKRHDNPGPTPDTTPHHEKNPVGGY